MLEKYPGAKTNSGIIHFLANETPLHSRYFELFAGSAQFFNAKRLAELNYLNDINPKVTAHLRAMFCNTAIVSNIPALHFLQCFTFSSTDFIYLDPPYPESSRRNGKRYYEFEMMEDSHHLQLLTAVKDLQANVMISTRPNRLYDIELKGWRRKEFETVDRAGKVTELIYMNYEPPALLHQYDFLGADCWDRQRINRKLKRFRNKIDALPPYEKHALIIEMIKNAPEVQTFLSVLSGSDKHPWPPQIKTSVESHS